VDFTAVNVNYVMTDNSFM